MVAALNARVPGSTSSTLEFVLDEGGIAADTAVEFVAIFRIGEETLLRAV